MASGYMARHILHWAKPDSPTYDEFFSRVENIDFGKKDQFLTNVHDLWINLGENSTDPSVLTRYLVNLFQCKHVSLVSSTSHFHPIIAIQLL